MANTLHIFTHQTCTRYSFKTPTNNNPIMTKHDLMQILKDLPDGAKISMYSDPETEGSFYVNAVSFDPITNRIEFQGPGCSNASDADQMDAGADWHYKR